MTLILLFFLSVSAWAQQQYQYRLEGSFQTMANFGDTIPATVNYSLFWNETSSEIQGIYQDNYFSGGIPRLVSGGISDDGRRFSITLPAPVAEVQQIVLSSSRRDNLSGSIPLRIVTANASGGTIDSVSSFGLLNLISTTQNNSSDSCQIGFGTLSNHCGLYGGNFNEISDPANRCTFNSGGNHMLELGTDTVFRIYPNYIPGAPFQPVQVIGAFAPTPLSNSINISGQDCTAIPGTTFAPDNCKVLNLTGLFFQQTPTILFTGTYTIRDQITGETCSYSMSLTRQTVY